MEERQINMYDWMGEKYINSPEFETDMKTTLLGQKDIDYDSLSMRDRVKVKVLTKNKIRQQSRNASLNFRAGLPPPSSVVTSNGKPPIISSELAIIPPTELAPIVSPEYTTYQAPIVDGIPGKNMKAIGMLDTPPTNVIDDIGDVSAKIAKSDLGGGGGLGAGIIGIGLLIAASLINDEEEY